jgi:hypothetical protein
MIDQETNPNYLQQDGSDLPETSGELRSHLQRAIASLDVKLEDELARLRNLQGQPFNLTTIAPLATADVWEQSTEAGEDSGAISAEFVKPTEFNRNNHSPAPESMPQAAPQPTTDSGYVPFDFGLPEISVLYQPIEVDYTRAGELSPIPEPPAPTNDYLVESEALRQQAVATPAAESVVLPSTTKSILFSPWKLGAIVATFALAGGAAMYTYLNPQLLAPQVATVAPTTSVLPGTKIQSPDLAVSEFTDLNLSTITTIQTQTQTAPAPAATTAPAPATTNAPVAVPYQPVAPETIAPPTSSAPQPQLSESLVKSLLPQQLQQMSQQSPRG